MSEEKIEPKFSIVKLIPVTVVVTILCQINVISYYSYFNFSATTYFEPYEMILTSLKDFIIIGFIILYSYKIMFLGIFSSSRKKMTSTFSETMRNRIKICKTFYGIAGILAVGLVIMFFTTKITNETIHNVIAITWTFLIYLNFATSFHFKTLLRLRVTKVNNLKSHFPYVNPILFSFTLMVAWGVFTTGIFKAEYIQNTNPYKGTELTLNDGGVIKCTSKVIFIGKSQKYYFIYNTPDKSVRVIKRDDLKKEVIRINPEVNFFYQF